MLTNADFYLVDRPDQFFDRPWAILRVKSASKSLISEINYDLLMAGKPVNLGTNLEMIFAGSGSHLSDMPACDGSMFVVSPKLLDVLSPYFNNSVRSCRIRICSEKKYIDEYSIIFINQGSEEMDFFKGESLFFVSVMAKYKHLNLKITNAYGIYFDISTWNGSDIFRMGESGNQMIVTRRVAEALVASELSGVQVTRLDRVGLPSWERYLQTGEKP